MLVKRKGAGSFVVCVGEILRLYLHAGFIEGNIRHPSVRQHRSRPGLSASWSRISRSWRFPPASSRGEVEAA